MQDAEDIVELARSHVKKTRDFLYHLSVWVMVTGMLIVVDRATGRSDGWFGLDFAQWVFLPWGLAVACHWVWANYDDLRVEQLASRHRIG